MAATRILPRAACRHCLKERVPVRRGLCKRCYYSPSVRPRYARLNGPSQGNVLLVGLARGKECMSLEALSVEAARAYPQQFSCRGFPGLPDTHRVRCLFYGRKGLIARGWFEWIVPGRTVRLTARGRALGRE